jgi:hypothetical protein
MSEAIVRVDKCVHEHFANGPIRGWDGGMRTVIASKH